MTGVRARAIDCFVQIGAARDGLDPYLDCARLRGMTAVLVETPEYLRLRRALGRRPFDIEIPVLQPEVASQVHRVMRSVGVSARLILPGFERYVGSSFMLAKSMAIAPWPVVGSSFAPLDKWGQRTAVACNAPHVPQPPCVRMSLNGGGGPGMNNLGFPQVVKPVDGGGGLGVFLVVDDAGRDRALFELSSMTNYGGAGFAGALVEERVEGVEHSIQGLAIAGRAVPLCVCEKVIVVEPSRAGAGVRGFREAGHIARNGSHTSVSLRELVQACLDATGYRQGPFHVDVICGEHGPVFLEMGFRLSGMGVANLVRLAAGVSWASLAFSSCLGEAVSAPVWSAERRATVGCGAVKSERGLQVATRLAAQGVQMNIEPAPRPRSDDLAGLTGNHRLAADMLRHGGIAGRVTVFGENVGEVRAHLHACLDAV